MLNARVLQESLIGERLPSRRRVKPTGRMTMGPNRTTALFGIIVLSAVDRLKRLLRKTL